MLHSLVEELPDDLPLLPWAEEEMRRTPKPFQRIFIRRSEKTWIVVDDHGTTLMAVGIQRPTQISTPELWVLLCEGFRTDLRRNLREIGKLFEELLEEYPHVMVRVDAQAPAGQKLVEYFGFTEYFRDVKDDREYIYYEVRRGVRSTTRRS
jgi:hypothetical protein